MVVETGLSKIEDGALRQALTPVAEMAYDLIGKHGRPYLRTEDKVLAGVVNGLHKQGNDYIGIVGIIPGEAKVTLEFRLLSRTPNQIRTAGRDLIENLPGKNVVAIAYGPNTGVVFKKEREEVVELWQNTYNSPTPFQTEVRGHLVKPLDEIIPNGPFTAAARTEAARVIFAKNQVRNRMSQMMDLLADNLHLSSVAQLEKEVLGRGAVERIKVMISGKTPDKLEVNYEDVFIPTSESLVFKKLQQAITSECKKKGWTVRIEKVSK